MDALKRLAVAFFLTLFPALAGCSIPLQSNASERAVAFYHESLGPEGAVSFHHEAGDSADKPEATKAADTIPSALTADTAIAMAKKNNVRLRALQAAMAAAEANVAAANRRANPELRVSQIRLDQFIYQKPQVRTALRFFPDRPGAIAANVADARVKFAQAQANLQSEEATLEADVRWAFDDLLLLDAEIAAANSVAQARQALAAHVQALMTMSQSTALDETLAELASLEADADLSLQKTRRKEALGTLLDRVGVPPDASVEITGDTPLAWPPPPLLSEKTLIEQALRQSPEVAVAASRMDAADARRFAERAKQLPWFTFLEAGYEFIPNPNVGLMWTFQGGVDLPIFDFNRNSVAAANATMTAAQRAFEAEVEKVVLDVRAHLREVRLAEQLVTEYRTRALPLVDKAGKEAQQALDAHNIDKIRALSVDEKRALVQLRLLRLIRRYRTAISDLRHTSGNVNSAATP